VVRRFGSLKQLDFTSDVYTLPQRHPGCERLVWDPVTIYRTNEYTARTNVPIQEQQCWIARMRSIVYVHTTFYKGAASWCRYGNTRLESYDTGKTIDETSRLSSVRWLFGKISGTDGCSMVKRLQAALVRDAIATTNHTKARPTVIACARQAIQ
jgi:hypothetical protein